MLATKTQPNAATVTRDEWLARLVTLLRPEIERRAGVKIPACRVRWVPAFEIGGALGQCSRPEAVTGRFDIKISEADRGTVSLADTVAHELLHAATAGNAHGWAFQTASRLIGQTGEPAPNGPAGPFVAWAGPLVNSLPPLPAVTATPPPQIHTPPPRRKLGPMLPVVPVADTIIVLGTAVIWGMSVKANIDSVMVLLPLLTTPIFGAVVWLTLPKLFTDSGYARRPNIRRGVIAAVFAVYVGAVVHFGTEWYVLIGYNGEGPAHFTMPEGDANFYALLWVYMLAAALFGVLIALPGRLAISFFSMAPARSFERGRFRGQTPDFLRRTRGVFDQRLSHYAKSVGGKVLKYTDKRTLFSGSPHDIADAISLVEASADVERARRNYSGRDNLGRMEPMLFLPAFGFVVEHENRPDGGMNAIVAYDLDGPLPEEDYQLVLGLGRAGSKWPPQRVRLRAITLTAADLAADPFTPPSTEKGGSRFHWPAEWRV